MSPAKTAILSCWLFGTLSANAAVSFVFDYSYDGAVFFTGANSYRQTYLESAAGYIGNLIGGTRLNAISPVGNDGYQAIIFDPNDITHTITINNPTVAADTILVYAGATSFAAPNTVAYGGPCGGSVVNPEDTALIQNLLYRGNDGFRMVAVGFVSFSTDSTWYFDSDPMSAEPFGTAIDFFSEAVHELFHVLGFGTSQTWRDLIDETAMTFNGSASTATNGDPVPTDDLRQHWANGTLSSIYGTSIEQETAMDPSIFEGARKYATDLDVAALVDLGYTTSPIPEPMRAGTILGLIALCAANRRSRG